MGIQGKLVKFYMKYKNLAVIRFLNKIYSRELRFPYDYIGLRNLRRKKRKVVDCDNRQIVVCFIANDPNVWNKLQPVYEEFDRREEFDAFILSVSDPLVNEDVSYQYFKEKGYKVYKASYIENGKNKLFDLKKINPDYIFYGQPYNNYLPRQFRTYNTSKYAELCFMTYGMTVSWNFLQIHPRNFYRDISRCYAVVREEIEFNKEQFPKYYKENLQITKYLGFPAFSTFMDAQKKLSKSFEFSRNSFRIIWTPRWITDENLGGSNFFRYKDVLINYASENPKIDMLFRPHPMALDNFIQTGEMSVGEVEAFRKICRDKDNLSLDIEKDYAESFWSSNVLISDLSTVVVEYFVTGKPIIYCHTVDSKQNYLDYFNKILSCNYVVENEVELINMINQLYKGFDPKKEERERMILELFGDTLYNSQNNIVDDIYNAYKERKKKC